MKGFMPSFLANKPEFLEEIFPAKQREQVSEYKEVSEIFGKYYRQHLLEWNMVKYRFDSSNRMLDARGNPMKVFINNAKETYGFKFTARNYENPKKEFFSEFQIEKSLVQ